MIYILLLFFFLLSNNIFTSQSVLYENGFTLSIWKETSIDLASVKVIIGEQNLDDSVYLDVDISSDYVSIEETPHYYHSLPNIAKKTLHNTFFNSGRYLIQDKIFFIDRREDIVFNNFTFILINNAHHQEEANPKGILGLSRGSLSFVNQLYNQSVIQYKIISFVEWEITIGGYSEEIRNNKASMIIATPLIDYGNLWATNLLGIIIGNIPSLNAKGINHIDLDHSKYTQLNVTTVFDTFEHQYILLPYSFGALFEKYFEARISKGECVMIDNYDAITFECDAGIINHMGSLFFVFEGAVVKISESALAIDYASIKKQMFPIIFAKYMMHGVIGKKFVNMMQIVLNDDNKTIGFPNTVPAYFIDKIKMISNDNSITEIKTDVPFIVITIIAISSILLVIGISCLLMIKKSILKGIPEEYITK